MGQPERYLELNPEWDEAGAPLLKFTADADANALLASDPNAFLIGLVLDQQIATERAFAGPAELKRRLGHLEPARIAAMNQDEFIELFRSKPAIHRFPASMGKRVHDACGVIAERWEGNAATIWQDQPNAKAVMKRLGTVPGIGKTKQQLGIMLLGRYFGVDVEGWREASPIEVPE